MGPHCGGSLVLPILSETQSSSSGTGVSYYTTRCPRKAKLDKQFRDSGGDDAQVGTLFHKMMELYYAGTLADYALPVEDLSGPEQAAITEAQRLFAAYAMYHPPTEFKVIATEKRYPDLEAEEAERVRQERLLGALLVDPFTMRIDLIVEFNEEQAEAAQVEGKYILPGRYLLDFKTAKATDSKAGMFYAQDRQFISYMAAYNLLFPKTPCQGLIARRCIRHQDLHQRLPNGRLRSFLDYVIPLPEVEDVQATARFFREQKAYLASDSINLASCRDWGGCPHLLSRACNQRY